MRDLRNREESLTPEIPMKGRMSLVNHLAPYGFQSRKPIPLDSQNKSRFKPTELSHAQIYPKTLKQIPRDRYVIPGAGLGIQKKTKKNMLSETLGSSSKRAWWGSRMLLPNGNHEKSQFYETRDSFLPNYHMKKNEMLRQQSIDLKQGSPMNSKDKRI